MLILSHRGCWNMASERNTPVAFERSLGKGFGIETDVRDALGKLVISHDPPRGDELTFIEFLDQYRRSGGRLPLALNVKADGLADEFARLITKQDNCFLFDMSTPDLRNYLDLGLSVFSRQSEVEKEIVFYDRVQGVWMDCFYDDWFNESAIASHLDQGKKVCLVSPELHNRDPRSLWSRLAAMSCRDSVNLMLCTDRPEAASSILI